MLGGKGPPAGGPCTNDCSDQFAVCFDYMVQSGNADAYGACRSELNNGNVSPCVPHCTDNAAMIEMRDRASPPPSPTPADGSCSSTCEGDFMGCYQYFLGEGNADPYGACRTELDNGNPQLSNCVPGCGDTALMHGAQYGISPPPATPCSSECEGQFGGCVGYFQGEGHPDPYDVCRTELDNGHPNLGACVPGCVDTPTMAGYA